MISITALCLRAPCHLAANQASSCRPGTQAEGARLLCAGQDAAAVPPVLAGAAERQRFL